MQTTEFLATAIGVLLMVTPKEGRMGHEIRPHLFVQSMIFGTAATGVGAWSTFGAAIIGILGTWLASLINQGILKRLVEVERQAIANGKRLETLACPFAQAELARCRGADHPLGVGEQLPHTTATVEL